MTADTTMAEDELAAVRAVLDGLVAAMVDGARWQALTVGPEACDLTGMSPEVTYAEHRDLASSGIDGSVAVDRAQRWLEAHGWLVGSSPPTPSPIGLVEIRAERNGARIRVGGREERLWASADTPCRRPTGPPR